VRKEVLEVPLQLIAKELAFYVEYLGDKGFIAPSDMAWEDDARKAVASAGSLVEYFGKTLPKNAARLRRKLSSDERTALVAEVRARRRQTQQDLTRFQAATGGGNAGATSPTDAHLNNHGLTRRRPSD
jgi:hypothetical protein